MDANWEHRIYRENAKKAKKHEFLADDFREIYTEYYNIYYDYLTNLVINLIHYKNAPKTLSQQSLEYLLRTFGYANLTAIDSEHIFVQGVNADTVGVNLPLGSLIGGTSATDSNFVNDLLDTKKVFALTRLNLDGANPPVQLTISNKYSFYFGQQAADTDLIERTARTLAEIKASILENIRQQKTPFIGFSKDGSLSSKIIWQKLAEGKPFIQIDSDQFDDDIRKVITTMPVQTPNLAPTLQDSWNSAMSEFLTLVGINNSNIDKKERLVASEATANDAQVSYSMRIYLNARNEQIDLLNKVLGTEIKAEVNESGVQELMNFAQTGTGGLSNDEGVTHETNPED